MSSNTDRVMPIDHRDCFAGANKFCHDELSEYWFIVDSHFFDQQISLEQLIRFFYDPIVMLAPCHPCQIFLS